MYAVIEAYNTYPADLADKPKTRRWGEPKLAFIARTWAEVEAWWIEQCDKCDNNLHLGLTGSDYIVVLTPAGLVSLAGHPIPKPMDDGEGWVQARLGVFGPPLTDYQDLQAIGSTEESE